MRLWNLNLVVLYAAVWVAAPFLSPLPEAVPTKSCVPPAPVAGKQLPGTTTRWTFLTVKFSPNGGCTAQIVKAIGKADKTVDMLAYSYTSKEIEKALEDAHRRGVKVRAIFDKSDLHGKGELCEELVKAVGKDHVWVDYKHAIAHNKVLILDGKIVMTGSFNFTEAAEHHNAENSLPVFRPQWVKEYQDNFELHRSHSVPWGTTPAKKHLPPAGTPLPEFSRVRQHSTHPNHQKH